MKNFLFAFLFCFSAFAGTTLKADGQAGLVSADGDGIRSVDGNSTINTQIGPVYTDDFHRADSAHVGGGWTEFASINAVIFSNVLVLKGSGDFKQRIEWTNAFNMMENGSFEVQFYPAATNSGGNATLVGFNDKFTGNNTAYFAQIDTAIGSGQGQLYVYRWTNSPGLFPITNTTAKIPVALFDTLSISFAIDHTRMTATISNVTQGGAAVSATFTNDLTSLTQGTNLVLIGPRYPCILMPVGTSVVYRATVRNNDYTRPAILVNGDSLTAGAHASDEAHRWINQLSASRGDRVILYGAQGARTSDALLTTNEMRMYYPKRAIIELGINDIANSVTTNTYATNMMAMASFYSAIGTDLYVCTLSPFNAIDVRPFNNWINTYTVAPSNRIIDNFTLLKTNTFSLHSAYDSGDGIHWNTLANTTVATNAAARIQ